MATASRIYTTYSSLTDDQRASRIYKTCIMKESSSDPRRVISPTLCMQEWALPTVTSIRVSICQRCLLYAGNTPEQVRFFVDGKPPDNARLTESWRASDERRAAGGTRAMNRQGRLWGIPSWRRRLREPTQLEVAPTFLGASAEEDRLLALAAHSALSRCSAHRVAGRDGEVGQCAWMPCRQKPSALKTTPCGSLGEESEDMTSLSGENELARTCRGGWQNVRGVAERWSLRVLRRHRKQHGAC